MTKYFRIAMFVLVLIGSVSFLTYYTYDGMSDDNFRMVFNEKYGIYALNIPEDITFAGEEIPFEDPEIYERFDREMLVNTYWQSQTLLFFKRSNRYFKVIEPILKRNGIPEDFKYLPLIESGLVNVVSPAGAAGFWQIMEATGKSYGLEINKEVDERYDVEKSTIAACKYLKQAYAELGSWTLAAASYNMGINGVKKQLERQKARGYYGLTLNSETERYVFRILAAKEIIEHPEKYGFHFREKDLYKPIPTFTVEVDTAVSSFGDFAHKFGINYRILKYHNPWLRYDYLPNANGKTYKIQIPKKGYFKLVEEEMKEFDDKNASEIPPISDTTAAVSDSL